MFKFSWIDKNIAVGSAFDKEDAPKIKQLGIDAIVDVRSEGRDDQKMLEDLGMRYIHIDVDDRYAPSRSQIRSVFEFVFPFLNQNKKIFVHCQNGYGRSPLVVISILMEKGMSVGDAIQLVSERHTDLAFTPQQEQFIEELLESEDGVY